MNIPRTVATGCAAAALVWTAACSPAAPPSPNAPGPAATAAPSKPGATAPGGTLTMAATRFTSGAETFDPALTSSQFTASVAGPIYEELFQCLPPDGAVKPYLLESATPAPDNMSWVFKLRQGIKFSNGDPMTADDVKFSLEVLGMDYIKLARAKGLPERTVLLRHALRNASIPLVTFLGFYLTLLLGGTSLLVETVFAWPGVGPLLASAVLARDFPVVQAIVILYVLGFVVISIVIDIVYAYLDPTFRFA